MANIFNSVFNTKVKSSMFDMSYDHKLSCNLGELVPFHLQEVVPGDRCNLGVESLVRFAPMLAPIMHRIDVYQHFFFVPNRITWPSWEQFITGGSKGSAVPVFPTLSTSLYNGKFAVGSLSDYLGASIPAGADFDLSALPFAAYQKVFSDWYRDENLQVSDEFVQLDDGNQHGRNDLLALRLRAWQHDYFTGALPWAQKGDPVDIPLGEFKDSPVKFNNSADPTLTSAEWDVTKQPGSVAGSVQSGAGDPNSSLVAENALYADNSELVDQSTTINDLRRAFKLQEFLEKNARGGTRYIENILSHFGVRSSDKRLQRSEFIGGSRNPVTISEVLQTSSSDETSPQANMSGHGVSVGAGKIRPYFVEEHGYILGILSVMPKTAYYQGIPRHFSRKDKLDFYWPTFQHIGEQAVLNQELYVGSADPVGVFGYVPRYAELKYMPSRISGDFRDTLLYWHLARKFDSDPALNSDFVQCSPDNRIFAVTDPGVDHLYCHVFNSVKMVRKMSKYSNPSF